MPYYIYIHPEKSIVKEIFQHMNDEHSYSEGGVKWNRVFTKPNFDVDTLIDAHSEKDFIRKTNKTKNLGEVWDEAAIQSERRAKIDGIDLMKEKTISDYEKKTKKRHPLKNDNVVDMGHFNDTIPE